jgi:hypothetical protein
MGTSTAYNLIAEDPSLKIIVIERDLSYENLDEIADASFGPEDGIV